MNSLLAALNTKFKTTSAMTNLFTGNTNVSGDIGLHLDEAPEEAEPPFLVAQVTNTPVQNAYGHDPTFSDVTIQYKVVCEGNSTAIAAMQTFMGTFDSFVPTLATGTCSGLMRILDPLPLLITSKTKSGAQLWQVVTQYVYSIEP